MSFQSRNTPIVTADRIVPLGGLSVFLPNIPAAAAGAWLMPQDAGGDFFFAMDGADGHDAGIVVRRLMLTNREQLEAVSIGQGPSGSALVVEYFTGRAGMSA